MGEADPLVYGVTHHVPGVHGGVHHVAGVHPAYAGVYSHPYHLNVMYGKREAEAEADPYVYGVTHHVPGVHAGVTHVAGVRPAYPGVYSHPYHLNVMYGKREAEPEAKPYTMGQVYTGLPVANVAGVHPAYPGVYSHPYHLNVMYGKREAEPEAKPY